jgi:hypothetical protein
MLIKGFYWILITGNIFLQQLFQPQIFANQILEEYNSRNLAVPSYLNKLISSQRTILGNSKNKVCKFMG